MTSCPCITYTICGYMLFCYFVSSFNQDNTKLYVGGQCYFEWPIQRILTPAVCSIEFTNMKYVFVQQPLKVNSSTAFCDIKIMPEILVFLSQTPCPNVYRCYNHVQVLINGFFSFDIFIKYVMILIHFRVKQLALTQFGNK